MSHRDGQVCIIARSKETKDEITANDESLSPPGVCCECINCLRGERVPETSVGHRRDRPAARDPSFLGERRAVTCRYFVVCWLDRSTSLQISALRHLHNSLREFAANKRIFLLFQTIFRLGLIFDFSIGLKCWLQFNLFLNIGALRFIDLAK
jgi:hypothetical protein